MHLAESSTRLREGQRARLVGERQRRRQRQLDGSCGTLLRAARSRLSISIEGAALKKLVMAVVILATGLVAAPAALAGNYTTTTTTPTVTTVTTPPPPPPVQYGYLEICKNSDSSAPVTGVFHFTVDGNIPVSVNTGGCTAPFKVPAGTATVVEQSEPYYSETIGTAIPAVDWISTNLATQTEQVKVVASNDVSMATTVEVTNKEQFGTMEICKSQQTGSGLTGSFTFTVSGPMGFTKSETVPVGACSDSFQVPAGTDEVDEVGTNNTDVVSESTIPANDLVTDNLAAGTSEVNVAQGSTDSNETIVTFVNSSSRLKICKIAGDYQLNGTIYQFTAGTASVTAVAEPAPGGCVLVPTPFPGGTVISIQEGIVSGTAVSAIDVSDNRAVPGSVDLANRKVSVVLGSGETDVTYTNKIASPGLLKVCKNAGPGVSSGQMFAFTIGSQTLSVPAGFCNIAGNFAFDSTQTITETPTAGLSVIGESVDPAADMVASSLSSGTISALIGVGVTEATFTNATAGTPPLPPPVTTPPVTTPPVTTPPVTGYGPGATAPGPYTIPTTTPPITPAPTPVVEPVKTVAHCQVIARLINHHLVLSIKGAEICNILLREFDRHGHVVGHFNRELRMGHAVSLKVNHKVARVRVQIRSAH